LLGFLIDLNYKLITTFDELFFIKDAISSYYFLQDIHSSTNSSYNSQIILKNLNKSEIKLFKNLKDINSYAPRDYTKPYIKMKPAELKNNRVDTLPFEQCNKDKHL